LGRPKKIEGQEATRERILQEAKRLFAEDGFHRTQLTKIARAVGVERPALFYYFKSKETLYAEVVRRLYQGLLEVGQAVVAEQPPIEEGVRRIPQQLSAFVLENRKLFAVVVGEMLGAKSVGRQAAAEPVTALVDQVEAFLRENAPTPIPPEAPVRGMMMQLFSSLLLKEALGDLGETLWGKRDSTFDFAKILFEAMQRWSDEGGD